MPVAKSDINMLTIFIYLTSIIIEVRMRSICPFSSSTIYFKIYDRNTITHWKWMQQQKDYCQRNESGT